MTSATTRLIRPCFSRALGWRTRDCGKTWHEKGVARPFDMRTAPVARGFFTGDYEALGVHEDTLLPFVVMGNSSNLTNRTGVFAAVRGEDEDTSGNGREKVNLNPQSVAERVAAR